MSQNASAQQYCLRWNNYQNNLTNVFDQLLQSEAFVDVTLACDGNSLKAHKMVLSACSPYFQSLFSENPCSHPIVILKDVKWNQLKAIVEFVYRGEINVSQQDLAPLLKVAEALKIRGLADVNRGSSATSTSASTSQSFANTTFGVNLKNGEAKDPDQGPSSRRTETEESGHGPVGSPRPFLNSQHLMRSFQGSSGSSLHHLPGAGSSSKRRKYSFDEHSNSTPPPPTPPDLLDDISNQLEIDSTNGDYEGSGAHSPLGILEPLTITPGIVHGLVKSGTSSATNALGPSPSTSTLSNVNELDLKPGIVEMIREEERAILDLEPKYLNWPAAEERDQITEEVGDNFPQCVGFLDGSEFNLYEAPGLDHTSYYSRKQKYSIKAQAKMLESSHAWLGNSSGAPPPLSDSYQYQIQSLWQKCWNTNQGGLHALRFRERGPLKSWRPETMAEAIFAVLREGLSLSQAARKFDIPYPTFVLYANRVHNMLGPSSDGSGANDLLSDMRPKGRGRPQRILLGTWPEDHIRGVIRAVVFRDGAKEELPYGIPFPRDLSQNGVDMTLHQQLMNPYLGLHHAQSQLRSSTSPSHHVPPHPTKSPTESNHENSREAQTVLSQGGQVERNSVSPASSTSSGGSKGHKRRFSTESAILYRRESPPPISIKHLCGSVDSPAPLPPPPIVTIKTEVYNSDDEEPEQRNESNVLNSPPISIRSPIQTMTP